MPEFYIDTANGYQKGAQPYLDAIARAVRDNVPVREWLLNGTGFEASYADARPLWREHWALRGDVGCPFWANYWYNPCTTCDCRIDGAKSMEIDALFFLENAEGRRLALHVEMKTEKEAFSLGQQESYRPRAACYQEGRRHRKGVLPHQDFMTLLLCGDSTDSALAAQYFDRVVRHREAVRLVPGYPGPIIA